MSRLDVLVTGGSRGLGLELARCHRRRGDRVAILARDAGRLDAALGALGGEPYVRAFAADVRDLPAVRRAVEEFRRWGDGTAVLYANAGAIERPQAPAAFDREVFETNFFGAMHLAEAWIASSPLRPGRIVLVSSFSAHRGLPHLGAYGASKAALNVYGESLRLRLADTGIGVTLVELGYLDTELASTRKPGFLVTRADEAAKRVVRAALGRRRRLRTPRTVAAMMLVLRALPDAAYDRLVAARYRKAPR